LHLIGIILKIREEIKGAYVLQQFFSRNQGSITRSLRLLGPAAVNVSAHEWITPIVAAFMARSLNPQEAVAGYALALSLAFFLTLPRLRIQALTLVFVEDNQSWRAVAVFAASCAAVVVSLISIVAFTPLSSIIFTDLFRIEESLADEAMAALKVLTLWGLFSVTRAHLYGVALRFEKANLLWLGAATGLVTATAVSLFLYNFFPELNSQIGAIAVTSAVILECTVASIGLLTRRKLDLKVGRNRPSQRRILFFFIPLLFAALLPSLTFPLLNFAMARSINPELAITAFTLAFGVFSIMSIPANGIQPVSLALFGLNESPQFVRLFAVIIGVLTAIPIILLTLSDTASEWVFGTVLGADDAVKVMSIQGLQILMLLPPWLALEQLYAAAIMSNKEPRGIVYINIGRLTLLLLLVFGSLFLDTTEGILVGSGIMSLTLLAEAIFAVIFGRSAFSSLRSRYAN
jgi:hypothetical protein